MGGLDVEMVEQAEGVVGHVLEQVGRLDAQPRHAAHEIGHGGVDLSGQARIAIVEADHVKATPGQQLAELAIPVDHLHPQAHYEQQRGL